MNMKEQAQALAKSFGVQAWAVECLLVFAKEALENNAELREMFFKSPDYTLKLIVKEHARRAEENFNKLRDPNSPEFKKLASDVYDELRKK